MGNDVDNLVRAGVLVTSLAMLAVAAILARPLALRVCRTQAVAFACLATTLPILAVTRLVQLDEWRYGFVPSNMLDWLGHWDSAHVIAPQNPQWTLNVLLFVPAGAVLTTVIRRAGVVAGALAAGALLIEALQGLTSRGAPDTADLFANALGGGLGVLIGSIVNGATGNLHWSRRAAIAGTVVLGTVAFGTVVTLALLADHHRTELRHRLEQRFSSTRWDDLPSPSGADSNIVEWLVTAGVREDSIVYGDRSVDVRYAIRYYGFERCVFVVLSDDLPQFREGSGDECTVFRG